MIGAGMRWYRGLVTGLVALGFGVSAASGAAAPGDLDKQFAKHGIALLPAESAANGLVLGTGGEPVTAGFNGGLGAAFAFTPKGALDPAFSGDGISLLPQTLGTAHSLARLSGGGFLLAGTQGGTFLPTNVYLARLTPAGTPDPAFGAGAGSVLTSLVSDLGDAVMAVHADGRIVVVASSPSGVQVARFLDTGAPDVGFAGGGVTDLPIGRTSLNAVAVTADGRIVVAASAASSNHKVTVARLLADGQPDPSFGGDGSVEVGRKELPEASEVIVDPRGRITVAGSHTLRNSDDAPLLIRLLASGKLDRKFGTGGVVSVGLGTKTSGRFTALVRAPQGRTVAVGQIERDALVARFDRKGRLDRFFGDRGMVRTHVANTDIASGVAIDPRKRIVVAGHGTVFELRSTTSRLFVLRYKP